jgi:hypothetical protein
MALLGIRHRSLEPSAAGTLARYDLASHSQNLDLDAAPRHLRARYLYAAPRHLDIQYLILNYHTQYPQLTLKIPFKSPSPVSLPPQSPHPQ